MKMHFNLGLLLLLLCLISYGCGLDGFLYPNNEDDYSFQEGTNIALSSNGATATAISEGCYMGECRPAMDAIDGSTDEFWASYWDLPAWLEIDFGRQYMVDTVAVVWNSHRHDFTISLSMDGESWTQVKAGRSTNSEGSSPVREVYSITPRGARYMRIVITTTSAPGSHIFQAAISEVEAYGELVE